jgi:hypothetical protein
MSLLPSRQYLYSSYYLNKKEDYIMLGQKWVRRNELLKIDVVPNPNLKIYESLRGNLRYLRDSFGVKMKREDDEDLIVRDYEDYYTMNEIYLCDIYTSLGLDYNPNPEEMKNVFEVYVSVYYPFLTFQNFEKILSFLNKKDETEQNLVLTQNRIIRNDTKLENEITDLVIETLNEEKEELDKYFGDNYILQSTIHVNMTDDKNITGTILPDKFNLYAIFDSFIVDDEYPFIQYNSMESGLIYKFYQKAEVITKPEILSKWFENAPYGLSIKKEYGDKFINININETGRIEYKITWKEDEKTTIEIIKKTYNLVRDLINKINNETSKVKLITPEDERFTYAFINTIQQFRIPSKSLISHNDLSDFARFFFPYVALQIEPRKREGKVKKEIETSKFGTYLRYKRVSRYENRIRMHMKILYLMKNFEFSVRELIEEVSKQFNLTVENAAKELDYIREKYGNVLRKSRKVLKKLKNLPKAKLPGIEINIQGRTPDNYKIRIAGVRSKKQLFEIINFMKTLIYLYVQTYLFKKPQYQKIKEKLKLLNQIARRRNRVMEIVDYASSIKTVKAKLALDKDRLSYKPGEGESQYTRLCQNSGEDKKRQPTIVSADNIKKLLEEGFKYDEESKMYLKEHQDGKRKIMVRAIPLGTRDGRINYYYCDPNVNKQHKFIGFLVKGNNPDGLCLPCCFKKDQYIGNNKIKKNYFKKCIGEIKDYSIEKKNLENVGDKLYILQETNKIQEGRFLFLPKYLDIYFNKLWGNQLILKNHYMINSETGYFLKFTVRDKKHHFLAAISAILDLSFGDIITKITTFFKLGENKKYFYFLNNGEIFNRFETLENYLEFLSSEKYLEDDVIGEILTIPGVIYPDGLNFYIFDKKTTQDSENQEKIIYNLECLNHENQKYLLNQEKNNIVLIKERKYFFPIFQAKKTRSEKKITLIKKFNYEDKNNNIIYNLRNLYQTSCQETILNFITVSSSYFTKYVIEKFQNNKLKNQHIDANGKVRYLNYDNFILPVYPSGLDYREKFTFDDIKKDLLDSVIQQNKNIKKIDDGYTLDKILYSKKSKDDYFVVGVSFLNRLILPVREEKISDRNIRKYNLKLELRPLDTEIDEKIKENKKVIDKNKLSVNYEKYLDEGYNLFRFELSNHLSKYLEGKKQIIEVVRSNLTDNEKNRKLKSLLISLINPKLMKYMRGGNLKKQVHLMVSLEKEKDLSNFKVNNTREFCLINKNKEKCNEKPFCNWSNDRCYFSMEDNVTIEYINRVIEEMILDGLDFKELIQEDNYFVSDIVDTKDFTQRKNQKILKADNLSLGKIMNEIFGENALPEIGKRTNLNIKIETEGQPELEQVGDKLSQQIISNQDSIIRAFVNGLYWIKNPLYSKNRRNLGFHSLIQNKLTQLLKAKIIDYVLNTKDEIKELKDFFSNSEKLNSKLMQFAKNKNNTNGIFEGYVLNKLFNIPIVFYNKYNEVYMGFNNGITENMRELEYLSSNKDSIKIKLDITEEIKIPRNIFAIYI